MRRVAIACVLAGCGRLGFDALGTGGPSGGDADDVTGDGRGGSASGGLVQHSPVVAGAGAIIVTFPMPSSGNTLFVALIAANANDLGSLTLPAGWSLDVSGSTSGACAGGIATSTSVPAGQTNVTFALPAGVPADVQVTEWAGVGAFDTAGFGGGGPGTSLSITTMTPAATAGDLAIATFCEDVNSPMFTAEPGWLELGQFSNTAASPSIVSEYQAGQPAATITATGTSSVSGKSEGTIIAFHVP